MSIGAGYREGGGGRARAAHDGSSHKTKGRLQIDRGPLAAAAPRRCALYARERWDGTTLHLLIPPIVHVSTLSCPGNRSVDWVKRSTLPCKHLQRSKHPESNAGSLKSLEVARLRAARGQGCQGNIYIFIKLFYSLRIIQAQT